MSRSRTGIEEYIFRRAKLIEWQKWLNQWRHDYVIDIKKIVHHDGGECTIYMTRSALPRKSGKR